MSELTHDELDAIKARLDGATPGPWSWLCRPGAKVISLESAKWVVMRFSRWGMQSATPAFKDKNKNLQKAAEFMEVEPGREHHAEWHRVLNHPDADLIAHAPTDVARLLAEVERQGAQIDHLLGQSKRLQVSHNCLERIRRTVDSVQLSDESVAECVERLQAENERLLKANQMFTESMQVDLQAYKKLKTENAALRARVVPNYSEQCPTLPGWYFVRHPRPDDNPDIVGEIYRASDGLLYVEICNSSIDADDWAVVQDAFMQGYRFAGPIPEPKGGGDADQG